VDRNVVIATVLIGLIMFVWLYFLSPTPQPQPVGEEQTIADTQVVAQPEAEIPADELVTAPQTSLAATDSVMTAAQQGRGIGAWAGNGLPAITNRLFTATRRCERTGPGSAG
jgi:hypothetical protein